jgi:hypothetical protein
MKNTSARIAAPSVPAASAAASRIKPALSARRSLSQHVLMPGSVPASADNGLIDYARWRVMHDPSVVFGIVAQSGQYLFDVRVPMVVRVICRFAETKPDYAALLFAIADVVDRDAFNTRQLVNLATVDEALRTALYNMNARRLGKLLLKIENQIFDGISVIRIGNDRDGAIWSLHYQRV